jgi:predicted dehydrogenase
MNIERVLIVGLGSIGQRHLRLARELLHQADIRVLRNQESDSVPEFSNGQFFTVENAFAFDPQIAIIANPATFHLEVAKALALNGTHLLIEKPLSHSTEGVEAFLGDCERQGIVVMTGYNLRYAVSLNKYREMIHDEAIGKILSVRCEVGQYLPSWRPGSDYKKGVSANRELGGGVLLELSHELDYLRWIFGEVEWARGTLSRQSDLEIDVEDSAHLVLGFNSDSEGHQLIANVNMDFIRQDHTRICTAIGENGSLRWNGLTGTIELCDQAGGKWRTIYTQISSGEDTYKAEWRDFLNCIDSGKNPFVSGLDGLKVLEIVEAARESNISDKRVMVISR